MKKISAVLLLALIASIGVVGGEAKAGNPQMVAALVGDSSVCMNQCNTDYAECTTEGRGTDCQQRREGCLVACAGPCAAKATRPLAVVADLLARCYANAKVLGWSDDLLQSCLTSVCTNAPGGSDYPDVKATSKKSLVGDVDQVCVDQCETAYSICTTEGWGTDCLGTRQGCLVSCPAAGTKPAASCWQVCDQAQRDCLTRANTFDCNQAYDQCTAKKCGVATTTVPSRRSAVVADQTPCALKCTQATQACTALCKPTDIPCFNACGVADQVCLKGCNPASCYTACRSTYQSCAAACRASDPSCPAQCANDKQNVCLPKCDQSSVSSSSSRCLIGTDGSCDSMYGRCTYACTTSACISACAARLDNCRNEARENNGAGGYYPDENGGGDDGLKSPRRLGVDGDPSCDAATAKCIQHCMGGDGACFANCAAIGAACREEPAEGSETCTGEDDEVVTCLAATKKPLDELGDVIPPCENNCLNVAQYCIRDCDDTCGSMPDTTTRLCYEKCSQTCQSESLTCQLECKNPSPSPSPLPAPTPQTCEWQCAQTSMAQEAACATSDDPECEDKAIWNAEDCRAQCSKTMVQVAKSTPVATIGECVKECKKKGKDAATKCKHEKFAKRVHCYAQVPNMVKGCEAGCNRKPHHSEVSVEAMKVGDAISDCGRDATCSVCLSACPITGTFDEMFACTQRCLEAAAPATAAQ